MPLASQAAQCACFCGDRTSGAQEAGVQAAATDCQTTCDKANKQYVGCFEREEDFPEFNDLCWTAAECNAYRNEGFGGVVRTGIPGGQHPTCIQGSGHCYSTGIPVGLNVPLLGVTKVSDLSVYVDLVYRFVLPAASLIAVVIAMIAGVQYATAGGNPGQITKAKQRLGNAIIGVVLLLSAYVIARLIDPRLVSFEAIRVPLVKQVVLIDPNSTCEALIGYGFGVSPSSGECGVRGTITSIDDIADNAADSNIKVGDSCSFTGCSAIGEACMSDGVCRTCDDSTIPSPSASVCAGIAAGADTYDLNAEHKYQCLFYDALGPSNACLAIETGSDGYLNCAQLISNAPADDPCSIYQSDVIINPSTGVGFSLGHTPFNDEAIEICQDDPCGVAKKAGKVCVAETGYLLDGITCYTK